MDVKKWLTTVIVASVIAGWIMPVSAADVKGRLFVEIKGLDGKPIKDVNITLVSDVTESKTYTITTDKKGKAMIVGIDPDSYTYKCEKDGVPLFIFKEDELPRSDGNVKLRPGVNVREEWTLLTEEQAKAKTMEINMGKLTEEERNKIFAEEAHNEGVTAFENNKMAEAKELFEKAIKLNPEVYYFAYLVLGQMAFNDHDVEQAQKYLIKAKELDTDDVAIGDIGALLGATYLLQENTDKAKEIWSEVVETAPSATVLYNLAGIEVKAGNLEEARKWLAMSVEKFPEDLNSIQLLGDIYIQDQDYPNALKLYEQLQKAMEAREDISPETLKDVKDTVKLLKETVK